MNFGDDVVFAAAEQIAGSVMVSAGRLYQFKVVPPPKIVIKLAIEAAKALGAAVFVDGLKAFFKRGVKSEFNFQLERGDGTKVSALVKTDDPLVLERAIGALETVAASSRAVEYDDSSGGFGEIAAAGSAEIGQAESARELPRQMGT